MNQTNYLKLFSIAAFIAFAAVSCWATAESLHLLLSSWPAYMCWIVTVGFFVIASIGSKMIVDSLNQNIYVEKRGFKLVTGIIILLVFWLVCSFPTNTHTFFYRNVINGVVTNDISTTRNYLSQIRNNTNNKNQAALKVNELKNDIDSKLGELEAEIKNEANPGFGSKSKEILRQFASLLGVAKIEPLSYKGRTKQEREKLCDAYRNKIYILYESKAANIRNNILSPNPQNLKIVEADDKNLELVKQYIDDGTLNLNDANDIKDVCDKLNAGYNSVKNNRNFVNFASEADEAAYTANNPVTKVKRMVSVFDVWEDFIKGEYDGHGFLFWIIISILVDVAAFIFFDIAFAKRDY
jgi:CRISPR/Cas system-associated exonuclease Cas4 (RecB family)